MSEKSNLEVDTTEANRVVDELRAKVEDTEEKLVEATKNVENQTQESFKEVQGMMRASYMMVSGITQVMGGDMGQIIASIYGVAVSAISTYQSIAAAMAASGVGTIQAILMTSSLITALVSLSGIMTGQIELSKRVSGLNMSLHGISGMIGAINF